MFPRDGTSRRVADVADGPGNTLSVVEVLNARIHWIEPKELDWRTMSFQFNDRTQPSLSFPSADPFQDHAPAVRGSPEPTASDDPRHPPVPPNRFRPIHRRRPPRSRRAARIERPGRSYVLGGGFRGAGVRARITRLFPNSRVGFPAPITPKPRLQASKKRAIEPNRPWSPRREDSQERSANEADSAGSSSCGSAGLDPNSADVPRERTQSARCS
jgi:hypothetical protein